MRGRSEGRPQRDSVPVRSRSQRAVKALALWFDPFAGYHLWDTATARDGYLEAGWGARVPRDGGWAVGDERRQDSSCLHFSNHVSWQALLMAPMIHHRHRVRGHLRGGRHHRQVQQKRAGGVSPRNRQCNLLRGQAEAHCRFPGKVRAAAASTACTGG